jgi:hypothetical protein
MKVIYVAGPYRDESAWGIEQNIRHAEEIGLEIAKLGAASLIPHTLYRFFQGVLPDRFWLDATLELMRRCDAILLCDGWKGSSGSVAEKHEAARIGLPIFYEGHIKDGTLQRLLNENSF